MPSVVLGIPSDEVILRLIEYPRMALEDVRGALALAFEDYFPYAYSDAVMDIAEVEAPVPGLAAPGAQRNERDESKIKILAAVSSRARVSALLDAAGHAGLTVGAVEPLNVAFFRASLGQDAQAQKHGIYDGSLAVRLEPDAADIVFGYRDNGLLFRSALSGASQEAVPEQIVREIQETLVFVGNRYRSLMVRRLTLGGTLGRDVRLGALLRSLEFPFEVTVMDSQRLWGIQTGRDFDAALGLALRDFI